MLSDADLEWMREQLAAVRADNAVGVSFRRGGNVLAEQEVRIAALPGGRRTGPHANVEQNAAGLTVLGGVGLDVEVGDRFDLGGHLCEVEHVHPNRRLATIVRVRYVE